MAEEMPSGKRCRLCLICTPRSGSTALLKCLSFVDKEVEVWFEPFIFSRGARLLYHQRTGRELPLEWTPDRDWEFEMASGLNQSFLGIARIAGRNYAYSEQKRAIEGAMNPKIIVKDMGLAFQKVPQYLPSPSSGFRYVFLIRDPYQVAPSYKRASFQMWQLLDPARCKDLDIDRDFDLRRDDPYYRLSDEQSCYESVYATWKHIRSMPRHEGDTNNDPLVIDYADLMAKPKPFLQRICEIGGFEFRDELLEWDPSSDVAASWKSFGANDDDDGGADTVQHLLTSGCLVGFHQTALASTGFRGDKVAREKRPSRDSLGGDVLKIIDEGIGYYTEMYEHRYIPQ